MMNATLAIPLTEYTLNCHQQSIKFTWKQFSNHLRTQHRIKAADCIVWLHKHAHWVAVTRAVKLSEFVFRAVWQSTAFALRWHSAYTAKCRCFYFEFVLKWVNETWISSSRGTKWWLMAQSGTGKSSGTCFALTINFPLEYTLTTYFVNSNSFD